MDWPLTLGIVAAWVILPPLVIVAVCHRTLFGDPVEDITDEHTQGHGVGGANIFNHGTEQ